MASLLLTLLLTGVPAPISDPRGFTFQVPEGFSAFPGFAPQGNKLYAYGKHLGTLEAITLTLDLAEGPVKAGGPSHSCGKLMEAINRTVGAPTRVSWGGTELAGLRMVMTHTFGEVVVLCVDVPVSPDGLSLMVSGKPANEPRLREAFEATLASISAPAERPSLLFPLAVAAPLSVLFVFVFVRRLRGSASRSSR